MLYVCVCFFPFLFFFSNLILSSSVSISKFYMFALVPGKNLFASSNQGCNGGWYTDFPNNQNA